MTTPRRNTRSSGITDFQQLPDKQPRKKTPMKFNEEEEDRIRKALIGKYGNIQDAINLGYISKVDKQKILKKGIDWYVKLEPETIDNYIQLYEKKLNPTPKKDSPPKPASPPRRPNTRSSGLTEFHKLPDKSQRKPPDRLNEQENEIARKAIIGFFEGNLEEAIEKKYISKVDRATVIMKGIDFYRRQSPPLLQTWLDAYDKSLPSAPVVESPPKPVSPPKPFEQPIISVNEEELPTRRITRSYAPKLSTDIIKRDMVIDPGVGGAAADKNAYFKDQLLEYISAEEKVKFFKIWPKGIKGNQIFNTFQALLNEPKYDDDVEVLGILNKLTTLVNKRTFRGDKETIDSKTPLRFNQVLQDLTPQEVEQIQNISDATKELQQMINSPAINRQDIAPVAQKVVSLIEDLPVSSRTRSKVDLTSKSLWNDDVWGKLKGSALGILQNIREHPFITSTPLQKHVLEQSITKINGMTPPRSVRGPIEQRQFGVGPGMFQDVSTPATNRRGIANMQPSAPPVSAIKRELTFTPSTATPPDTPSTATNYTPSTATATPSMMANTFIDENDFVEIGIYLPDITNTTPGNTLRSFRLTGDDLLYIAKYLKSTV